MTHGRQLILLVVLAVFCEAAVAKSLAISLDDSPRHARGYFDGNTRASELISEIKRHNIPQVAFFSVGQHVHGEGRTRLMRYAEAGHVIANHTHTHADFNRTSLKDYITEFEQAESILKGFPNYRKWFRFPYLREGNTEAKRDGMRSYLEQKGYLNAYITLNNYDWYLENLFQQAVADNQPVDFEALGNLYVSLIVEGIEFYDVLAVKYLGRSPKHVLLLHEMDITALYLGDLVDALRNKGWTILPVADAFDDAIADYQAERVFKYNPGRVGEIAYSKGQKKGLWHHSLDESYIKARFDNEVLIPKASNAKPNSSTSP